MSNIKSKVVHSQTKSAWNVIGEELGGKYKLARIPYLNYPEDPSIDERERKEAFEHAEFISRCFNNRGAIENFLKKNTFSWPSDSDTTLPGGNLKEELADYTEWLMEVWCQDLRIPFAVDAPDAFLESKWRKP
jgi:hypothetical protein